MKTISASELKKDDQLKTAYNSVIVVDVKIRANTSKVFYKCIDGFVPNKNWFIFNNNHSVRVLN